MDQGQQETVYSVVESYDQESLAMTHTVTYAADNIVTGNIYSFRFKAYNSKGYSEYSEILRVAATSVPSKAVTP
jgi:hypothetical protein